MGGAGVPNSSAVIVEGSFSLILCMKTTIGTPNIDRRIVGFPHAEDPNKVSLISETPKCGLLRERLTRQDCRTSSRRCGANLTFHIRRCTRKVFQINDGPQWSTERTLIAEPTFLSRQKPIGNPIRGSYQGHVIRLGI